MINCEGCECASLVIHHVKREIRWWWHGRSDGENYWPEYSAIDQSIVIGCKWSKWHAISGPPGMPHIRTTLCAAVRVVVNAQWCRQFITLVNAMQDRASIILFLPKWMQVMRYTCKMFESVKLLTEWLIDVLILSKTSEQIHPRIVNTKT